MGVKLILKLLLDVSSDFGFIEVYFDVTFAFTACDGGGNYSIGNFVPGNYFMDAWKDNDNNAVWAKQAYFQTQFFL